MPIFCTPDGAFDAVIDQMEPSLRAGRSALKLEGRIRSGAYDGLYFAGTYDPNKKSGLVAIHVPSDAAAAV